MGDILPHIKLKIPYVNPIADAPKTVEVKRSGTYMPSDILKPLPTAKIEPAIRIKKNFFILINLYK